MSVQKIKAAVRQRDGMRCTECGMTNEEHRRRYRNQHGPKSLEVHRIMPGGAYTLEGCVTLCVACHHRKPKQRAARRVNVLALARQAAADRLPLPRLNTPKRYKGAIYR